MPRKMWVALQAATAAHTLWSRGPPTLAAALLDASHVCASAAPSRARSLRPRGASIVMLNRLLLEPDECTVDASGRLTATLPPGDPRTVHVRTQLKAVGGQAVRAGVVDAGATDEAVVRWVSPSGGADEDLRLELGSPELLAATPAERRPRVDLVLAMPRPLQFARLLPMISSLGVDTLWVTGALKMDRSFFSSHLIRAGNEAKLREALREGLAQSGDTALPRVVVRRGLVRLLRDEFGVTDDEPQQQPTVRLACHPDRGAAAGEPLAVSRLGDVSLPPNARVVLAVGPERGWEEPDELELLKSHGFELVSLGPRTLRTDVAVVSTLAVVHDRLAAADERR